MIDASATAGLLDEIRAVAELGLDGPGATAAAERLDAVADAVERLLDASHDDARPA